MSTEAGAGAPQSEIVRQTAPLAHRRPAPTVAMAELDYRLVCPRGAAQPLLSRTYEAWRDGWRSALQELSDTAGDRGSDEFTRQDEIGVIDIRGACASLTALRWCDLSQPMWLEDSYFRKWPTLAVARLGRRRVCISSNTLIVPEWRGARVSSTAAANDQALDEAETSTPLKVITVALSIRRFLSSSADLLVGVSRNDRSMDRVARELGMERIASMTVHGIESDVFVAERSGVRHPHAVVEALWERRR
jgi:hypothetical protein